MKPKKFLLIKRVENGWLIERANEVGERPEEQHVATTNNEVMNIVGSHVDSFVANPANPVCRGCGGIGGHTESCLLKDVRPAPDSEF